MRKGSLIIGVAGSLISIYGVHVGSSWYGGEIGVKYLFAQSMCFAIGSTLLMVSAYMERLELFAWLEFISVGSAFLGWTSLPLEVKAGLPAISAVVVVVVLWDRAKRTDLFYSPDLDLLWGAVGMIIAVTSYSLRYEELYVMAGLFLGFYAYRGTKENSANWIWVVLNVVYIGFAAVSLALNGYICMYTVF